MKRKMLLCGNYGAGNLGDEAILTALLEKWRDHYDITVMTPSPESIEREFKVPAVNLFPTGLRSSLKRWLTSTGRASYQKTVAAISKCDLFVLGGGTLLTDEPWQSLWIWGRQIEHAYGKKKPIEIHAAGIGPFHRLSFEKQAARLLGYAEKVSVRDELSKEWCSKLGRTDAIVAPDPVMEWKGWDSYTKAASQSAGKTIIFVPRFWTKNWNKTEKELIKFIRYLALEKNKNIVGLSFDKSSKKDKEILNKIFEQAGVGKRGRVVIPKSLHEAIQVMQRSEAVVGMRLHSLIFAEKMGIPWVGIGYMEKVRGVAKTLGKENQIVDLEHISMERLQEAYIRCKRK